MFAPSVCCCLTGWSLFCSAAHVVSRPASHRFREAQHKLSTAWHRQQRQPTHSSDHSTQGSPPWHWRCKQPACDIIRQVC
jgi:hypothetical protein